MGAILAAICCRSGLSPSTIVARMAEKSPYRGRLEMASRGRVALGVQSLGWDASLAEVGPIQVAFHGYLSYPEHLRRKAISDSWAAIVGEAWLRQGPEVLAELDGEFAFLIWNEAEERCFAACSIGGTRPAFYATEDGVLAVATEVRQVRAGLELEPELDEANLVRFLLSQPIAEEGTLDCRVARIYPSKLYCFRPTGGKVERDRRAFWHPPAVRERGLLSVERAAVELRRLLEELVVGSLPPRPAAFSLSGGLDSGTIWTIAAPKAMEALGSVSRGRPYSLVFPGMDCDERPYIEATLKATRAQDPVWIDAAEVDPLERSLSLTPGLDTHPYVTSYHFDLMAQRAAASSRPVLFAGVGGDEWLGSALPPYLRDELSTAGVLSTLKTFLRFQLPTGYSRPHFIWEYGLKRIASRVTRALRKSGAEKPSWMSDRAWKLVAERRQPDLPPEEPTAGHVHQHLQRTLHKRQTGLELWALEQIAAHRSCELRLPLMQRRLIDFSFATPPELILAGRRMKHLLRCAMQAELAPVVRDRLTRTTFEPVFAARRTQILAELRERQWALVGRGLVDAGGLDRLIESCHDTSGRALDFIRLVGLCLADSFAECLHEEQAVANLAEGGERS